MKQTKSLKSVLALGVLASLAACSPTQKGSSLNTSAESKSIIGGSPVTDADVIGDTKIPSTIASSTVAILTLVRMAPNSAPSAEKKDTPQMRPMDAQTDAKEPQIMQFTCTGSLLANNVVLTAGHCVYKAQPGEKVMTVIVFTKDINTAQKEDIRVVTQALVHPDYNKTGEHGEDMNDVALMKFSGPLASGYKVANFLQDESVLTNQGIVTLAGYGLTDGVNKTSDNILRKVDVKIAGAFGKTEVVLDQSQGKGACHGDSGGPAFVTVNNIEYVWGITSRGIGKDGADDCSLYAIYTRVKQQETFIQSALKTLQQK
ncbi:MAG: serine protease [Bdellovibrio sp.]|nr:serine protease [Bdellovibrio sp.]